VTDAECVKYVRSWGENDCWNPKMQEAVAVVCNMAEAAMLTREETEKLQWLLDKSTSRPVRFLERLLPSYNNYVPRDVFDSMINKGKEM
jgi:hypothetical protein